jgi:hypothetical protein
MRRLRQLALAFVAAAMHVVAPVAAYANASIAPLPGDFCSVTRTAATLGAGGIVPLPASSEHHCAHAPCCAGGAVNAAAPPPSAQGFLHVASAGASLPVAIAPPSPAAPLVAAQPRGPPQIS